MSGIGRLSHLSAMKKPLFAIDMNHHDPLSFPVGHSAMAPTALGLGPFLSMKLGATCAWTYSPNSALKSFLKSGLMPVKLSFAVTVWPGLMMVLLALTQPYTCHRTSLFGMLNGVPAVELRSLSLIIRISTSASATCVLLPTEFMLYGIWPCRLLNSLAGSVMISFILNPCDITMLHSFSTASCKVIRSFF